MDSDIILDMLTDKRSKWFKNLESTLLLIEIPRTNDKKELSAEQMFASLHGILRQNKELRASKEFQEHIGFEIVSVKRKIQFYIWTPSSLTNFVEGQVYAQYPDAQIKEIDPAHDYVHSIPRSHQTQVINIKLIDDETLPITTFPSFEVDPLAAITATLAKLESEDEVLGIQILARPIDDSWHKASGNKIKSIKNGKTSLLGMNWITQAPHALWAPPEATAADQKVEVSERDRARISAIEEKSRKLGYRVTIRLIYSYPDKLASTSRLKLQALLGAFKQFNTTNLNGFIQDHKSMSSLSQFMTRDFTGNGFILNIEELASLYHLPHSNVETPNIVWARSRTGEPPTNLPVALDGDKTISPIGRTTFRGDYQNFGLARADRGRHIYIIGQTGVGKSALLELMTLADIRDGQGFALIDPHGDLAVNTLMRMTPDRLKDVVYFNPADTEFPIGFNPLEYQDESQKSMVASEIVGSLKKMFDSWGPRLEYILRYTVLSLLETPSTTMLDITRLLTDNNFQKTVVANVKDPVVKNFWTKEYASWNEKYRTEAVAPVLNKVGAFTANPIIRNIVGQPSSGFNVRQIMDEGKILIINLSRGLIGEDNAAILGSLLVTKIQLAAMSRADIVNIEDRRPFYLYVDEFQNFATDSFATILSEARKYGLNLTVANQYISQMTFGVRDAVFGNVGSIISFRVSPDDASSLQKYFEPQFESTDLIQLHNRDFLANLTIYNEKTVPFSAVTLDLPNVHANDNLITDIISRNRVTVASKREDVEEAIMIDDSKNNQPRPSAKSQIHPKPPVHEPISIPSSPESTPEIAPPIYNPETISRDDQQTQQQPLRSTRQVKPLVIGNLATKTVKSPPDNTENTEPKSKNASPAKRRRKRSRSRGSSSQNQAQNLSQPNHAKTTPESTPATKHKSHPKPSANTKSAGKSATALEQKTDQNNSDTEGVLYIQR